jgi:hypothetical protein
MERTKITYFHDRGGHIIITRINNAAPAWSLPAEYLAGTPCYYGVFHQPAFELVLEGGNQVEIREGSIIDPTYFPILIKAMRQSGERLGACLERAKQTQEIEI